MAFTTHEQTKQRICVFLHPLKTPALDLRVTHLIYSALEF
jgi:hypothetical protein